MLEPPAIVEADRILFSGRDFSRAAVEEMLPASLWAENFEEYWWIDK